MPLAFAAGRPWLLAFAAVWGAAVIADSGVFSTLLSELADRRYLGTALTAQTAIGFLLTIVTVQAIPLIVRSSTPSPPSRSPAPAPSSST